MTQELYYRSATALSRMLRDKQVSAREVVTAHLERIEAVNPAVNAIVTLTAERALDQAARQDDAAARGEFAGPLHGLPVAHKDNHLTAGIRTTFGSLAHTDLVPDADDLVIERMRAAGVITLGKTNIPEFAAGGHTFNEVFGVTRNPYDLSVTAGGSSGGAAAALATWDAPAGRRQRHGRLAPVARRVLQRGRAAAVGGAGAGVPRGRRLRRAVGAGADGADRRRCRAAAVGDGRTRPPLTAVAGGTRVDRSPRCRMAAWPDAGSPSRPTSAARSRSRTRSPGWCGRRRVLCEGAGAVVEQASPDFSGADECFRTLRAWQFEATLGAAAGRARRRRSGPACTRTCCRAGS